MLMKVSSHFIVLSGKFFEKTIEIFNKRAFKIKDHQRIFVNAVEGLKVSELEIEILFGDGAVDDSENKAIL